MASSTAATVTESPPVPWTYDLKRASPDILRAFSLMFHDPQSDELQALLKKSNLTNKKWKVDKNVYSILKYNAGALKCDELQTIGLLRSLVLDQHGKIIAYSPPKCVVPSADELNDRFSDDNILVEELVEGTMINVFYHKPNGQDVGADWEIATKSCVGAKIVFHSVQPLSAQTPAQPTPAQTQEQSEQSEQSQPQPQPQPTKKTFRTMFLECMNEANLEFDALQKDCSYSFVMQHPNNHIVREITKPTLYLIAVYKIDNEALVVEEQCRDDHLQRINASSGSSVRLPLRFTDIGLHELREIYTSLNSSYDFPGLICRESSTGVRFKFRNPNYERLKNLHGVDHKLQFQYLSLRQQGKVKEYLQLHPEYREAFQTFRDQLHAYTNQLFTNYINCYVKKLRPFTEFPPEFKTHMFRLHERYLKELREKKEHITLGQTIAYMNGLFPSHQIYALNYGTRKACEKACEKA
jgi:hypothetical protein